MVLRPILSQWRLSLIAVISLAAAFATALIGVGVLEALLLRPPGVPAPGQLVTMFVRTPDQKHGLLSYPEYVYYRDHNEVLSGAAAAPEQIGSMALTDGNRHELVFGSFASSNFFEVLRVSPELGDLRFPADEGAGPDTAVISFGLWNRLGADPAIIGRTISIDRHAVAVIGVVPERFSGMMLAFQPDVWLSLRTMATMTGQPLQDATSQHLMIIGRLRQGIGQTQATANVALLSRLRSASLPEPERNRSAFFVPTTVVPADSRPDVVPFAVLVLSIATLALVAAGANVTNLAVATASVRRQEMLIRSALGASRRQLMGQLFRENLAISIAAGVLGLGFAYGVLAWLTLLQPQLGRDLPSVILDVRPDLTMVLIAAALVLTMGLLTGVLPALRASRAATDGTLNRAPAIGGAPRSRLRSVLVATQVAAATLVLIFVGWCLQSVSHAQRANPGFSARELAVADLDLPLNHYSAADGHRFSDRVRQALTSMPDVEAVSVSEGMQLGAIGWGTDRVRPEPVAASTNDASEMQIGVVDDQYFATLGIRVIAGRGFDARDRRGNAEVVVVNETMARRFWPDRSAVGRRIHFENGNRVANVIGVAADSLYASLDEAQAPFVYVSAAQHELEGSMAVIVRTTNSADVWRAPLARVLRSIDPALEFRVSTLDDARRMSLIVPRMTLVCAGVLGAIALLLAMSGLFGTVYHSVSTRSQEMGVRIALGATPRELFRMVLVQIARLTGAGAAVGMGLAMAALPLVSALFFNLTSSDMVVNIAVLALIFALAIATAYAAASPWVRASAVELLRASS